MTLSSTKIRAGIRDAQLLSDIKTMVALVEDGMGAVRESNGPAGGCPAPDDLLQPVIIIPVVFPVVVHDICRNHQVVLDLSCGRSYRDHASLRRDRDEEWFGRSVGWIVWPDRRTDQFHDVVFDRGRQPELSCGLYELESMLARTGIDNHCFLFGSLCNFIDDVKRLAIWSVRYAVSSEVVGMPFRRDGCTRPSSSPSPRRWDSKDGKSSPS